MQLLAYGFRYSNLSCILNNMTTINVNKISKIYDSVSALEQVTLDIKDGDLFFCSARQAAGNPPF
jgi:hypothetical protein